MKFFESSEDIVDMVEEMFYATELGAMGLNLNVISTTKSKDVIKASRASATTEFLVKKEGIITVIVYEEAFDRLSDEQKKMMVEMTLSNFSYDVEKDRLIVETNPFVQVFSMRKKYGEDFLNTLETAYLVVKQIEDEQKAKKEAEKEAKKAAKQN